MPCSTAKTSRLVPFYEAGTSAEINYLAALGFDKSAGVAPPDECVFNTDGKLPAYDLMSLRAGWAVRGSRRSRAARSSGAWATTRPASKASAATR